MKAFASLLLLALTTWAVSGCASQAPATEAQAYRCPGCSETVRWSYRSDKFGLHNKKSVTHACPSCEKSWTAGVSEGNACEMCSAQSLVCPICAKYHEGMKS